MALFKFPRSDFGFPDVVQKEFSGWFRFMQRILPTTLLLMRRNAAPATDTEKSGIMAAPLTNRYLSGPKRGVVRVSPVALASNQHSLSNTIMPCVAANGLEASCKTLGSGKAVAGFVAGCGVDLRSSECFLRIEIDGSEALPLRKQEHGPPCCR